jgi:hypothetical protein
MRIFKVKNQGETLVDLNRSFLRSILPTFYVQLFHTKVLLVPLLHLYFRFVLFWRRNISAKTTHKMLVKLNNCLRFFKKPQLSNPDLWIRVERFEEIRFSHLLTIQVYDGIEFIFKTKLYEIELFNGKLF